ncbi:MAG: hypothetical protein JNM17_26380 [Archangium sp.]|nr:hypothetical protein [Archangium sp.]
MSVPGLKPTVEFEEQPTPRLLDTTTGQALPLTETEAQLLKSWDGSASATRLSAAVFMHGLDIEPWQIEQFFERLERAGVLATARPNIPNYTPAQPGVENPEDIVPSLRADLIITRPEGMKGTMQVKDPIADRVFTLYDFEVSIARMLDGKRSAAEVLTAANRLGIPVNLGTLKTFLQQLKAYKFIDQDVTGGDSTWAKRSQWTEEVRQLYQGALRMMRSGKFDEALSYADAMAEADPTNPEAKELRARIEEEAKGSHELRVDFETLHTPIAATKIPADETGPFASFGFNSSPPALAELPPIPSALNNPVVTLPKVSLGERLKQNKKLVIGAGAALVLLIVLFRPVSVTQVVACELQLAPLGTPRTARGGKVIKKEVAPGAKVEKGAVLARLGAGESMESLDAKEKELKDKLAALPPAQEGKKVDAARANVRKAEAAVATLEKIGKQSAKNARLVAGKLKAKRKALDQAKAQLDKLTHDGAKTALEEELKGVATRKMGVQAELEKSIVLAPVAGVFVSVGPLPEELAPNDPWGQIAAPFFTVITREPLIAGAQSATFKGPGLDAEVTIVEGKAQVPVAPALVGAKGTLELSAGRTPWLLSLF